MTNVGYTPGVPICAIATALSPAALGVVRASGEGCVELLSAFFSRADFLRSAPGNTLVHGWLKDSSGGRIDEVMVGVYRAPHSFTGEDMVEVYCHGGVAVVRTVHSLLLSGGFRQAERGEFTFRAFINGKTDLTRAEAVREIIDSKTGASLSHAAGRLSGAVRNEVESIKQQIVSSLASLEVEIEYPEDEETIAGAFDDAPLREVEGRLSRLAGSWRSEKLFQDGLCAVLCGPVNAGKSSLFNALLKEDRALVSDVAGTTRDWIEGWASFDGLPVRLLDTAGLRSTSDIVEAAGIERTKDMSREADIIIYVVDSAVGMTAADEEFISGSRVPVIRVLNKCDIRSAASAAGAIAVSARTGEGIPRLVSEVVASSGFASASRSESAGLGSERQKEAVQEALERVRHALLVNAESGALDAVVQDLEDSLDSLGEITGAVVPDDILDSVFSRFCVGK